MNTVSLYKIVMCLCVLQPFGTDFSTEQFPEVCRRFSLFLMTFWGQRVLASWIWIPILALLCYVAFSRGEEFALSTLRTCFVPLLSAAAPPFLPNFSFLTTFYHSISIIKSSGSFLSSQSSCETQDNQLYREKVRFDSRFAGFMYYIRLIRNDQIQISPQNSLLFHFNLIENEE